MWGSSPAGWFGLRVSFSGSRSQAEFSVGSSVHRHRRFELQLLAWHANRNATGLTELISGWNTARLKSRLNTCRKSMMRLATRCPVGHTRVQNQNQNHSCTAHHTDLRNDPETKRLKGLKQTAVWWCNSASWWSTAATANTIHPSFL